MSAYLASFVPALANHIWQSTAFAAAAWLLTILLRKNSARVRYGIWLAASIKFLIPFSLLVAMGGLLPKPRQVVAPAVYTAMQAAEQPFADISAISPGSLSQAPTLTQRITADLPAALLALWLLGTVTVVVVWFLRWRKASIDLREAKPATHGRELEILRGLETRLRAQDCVATSGQPYHLAEKAGLGRASFSSDNQNAQVGVSNLGAWPRLQRLFRRLLFSGTRIETACQESAPLGAAQLSPARQGWVPEPKKQSAVGATQATRVLIVRAAERAKLLLRRSPLRLALSSKPTEPSIYGIFRPVLVWPRRLSERLSDDHIEAIMAHELAHARRFDNATAALHMLVEAVFWFHPLVWWMERRMIEERERACDEAVVALGRSPDAYAEGILETCRFCVAPAVPCVSGITGADLRNRVVSIMTSPTLTQITWPKKILIGCAALCLMAVPVLIGQLQTQPSFEVVSVRKFVLDHPGPPYQARGMGPTDAGRWRAVGVSAKSLICMAYDLQLFQVSGGPPWIQSEAWSIDAKVDDATAARLQNMTRQEQAKEMNPMLQTLLRDRFKLQVTRETKEGPAFALVVAKGGPKLKDFAPGESRAASFNAGTGLFVMTTKGTQMSNLAAILESQLKERVLDQSGLTGTYDIDLQFVPPSAAPSTDASADSGGESIFDALQDQLGLKLIPVKAPMETMTIDHIEEPTPN